VKRATAQVARSNDKGKEKSMSKASGEVVSDEREANEPLRPPFKAAPADNNEPCPSHQCDTAMIGQTGL
jgi:hypothetical protein